MPSERVSSCISRLVAALPVTRSEKRIRLSRSIIQPPACFSVLGSMPRRVMTLLEGVPVGLDLGRQAGHHLTQGGALVVDPAVLDQLDRRPWTRPGGR